MSEYEFVEKPFLDQLEALGWTVIDQGPDIPSDPSKSLRNSFREVILRDEFNKAVRRINVTDDGREWLTDKQLDKLFDDITGQTGNSLREINENVQELLYRIQADENELTGEEDPNVKLIDFKHPERNTFHAINQFRIDTPGGVKLFIIPDIVLFVNGLPLVVVEAKDRNQVEANPMAEAFKQLMRYSEQREETKEAGLKEGEPRLFHTNQFIIRTCGDQCEFGTVTSTDEEYFYPWRDIYPVKYRKYEPPLGKERQQELLVQGMLPKETLLDIVRNCTVFMDVGDTRAKIVCRYQQYRAMLKIVDRLRTGQTPTERSGVVWHTQGSGKSLSMVFLIRKLRRCDDLKDYKVCLINDRTDLEEQLGKTAALAGEKVTYINSTGELRERLASDFGNLNMVMVHKFQEAQRDVPDYLESALEIPRYESFGIVNSSERILLMIDEAHRTQSGDLGDNLFEAFPNATRLAFTGTPLIVVKDKKQTVDRFGTYIDKYKLQDAVDDGATVQILYEGKTADSAIERKAEFDQKVDTLARTHVESQLRKQENVDRLKKMATAEGKKFDDLVKEKTDEEILELKKKWGTTGDILEADKRIEEIAADVVDHYVANILPNGFKAQVVCASKIKKAFDLDDPNKEDTGIAFLIVCDMLLTGFDAPIEQVMYIDKKVKDHNLLQTIARVNRVAKGKSRGYIIDYIGLSNHLKQALSIYAGEDQADLEGSFQDIAVELPVLETRYQRLLNLFKDCGVVRIEEFVNQQISDPKDEFTVLEDAIDKMEDVRRRSNFEVYLKKFYQSMDIVLPHSAANPYKIPAKRFGYLLVRVRERYKDETLSITDIGGKVQKLIDQHLISLGINPKIPPVELLSSQFVTEIEKNKSSKAKASEMEHAIRKHCKVKFEQDPAFYRNLSDKLEELIKKHKDNWDELYKDMFTLRKDAEQGRKASVSGVTAKAEPFYDVIVQEAFGKAGVPDTQAEQVKTLANLIIKKLGATIYMTNFWRPNNPDVEQLQGDLSDLILLTGIDEVIDKTDKLVADITQLAKVRHSDIVES